MNLFDVLRFEEGYRETAYLCSESYVTIGIGTKLHKERGLNPDDFCLTVSPEISELLMKQETDDIWRALSLDDYDHDRAVILASMAYQLGVSGLKGFRNMWSAIDQNDWLTAADEALDSRWSKQTPSRAQRHADVLRGNSLDQVYSFVAE